MKWSSATTVGWFVAGCSPQLGLPRQLAEPRRVFSARSHTTPTRNRETKHKSYTRITCKGSSSFSKCIKWPKAKYRKERDILFTRALNTFLNTEIKRFLWLVDFFLSIFDLYIRCVWIINTQKGGGVMVKSIEFL